MRLFDQAKPVDSIATTRVALVSAPDWRVEWQEFKDGAWGE